MAELDLQASKHFPVTGSEDTVVADVDEAEREDVLGIATHELHPGKGYLLDLAVVTVVLILKGDILVIHREDARVSDGHAVGIAGEILQRALRSADRALRIDHPRLGKALGPNCTRDFPDRGEFCHILRPEHIPEGLHGKEERFLLSGFDLREGLPPARLRPPASPGHDAVQVGMEHEIASPGMQQGCHPQLHTSLLPERLQGIPRCVKQRSISRLLVAEDELVQRLRNGEHDVEVSLRQQFFLAGKKPGLPLRILTPRTVTVPATVIECVLLTTFRTYRHVSTQSWCTTVAYVLQHRSDMRGRMIPRSPCRTEPDKGFGYSAHHGYFTGNIRSVGPTQRVSYGAVATFR